MNTSQFTLLTSARDLLGVLAMLLTLLFATVALADDDDEEAEERPEYVVLSQERMLEHDIVTASAASGSLWGFAPIPSKSALGIKTLSLL